MMATKSRGQRVKSFTTYVPGGANVDDREKTTVERALPGLKVE